VFTEGTVVEETCCAEAGEAKKMAAPKIAGLASKAFQIEFDIALSYPHTCLGDGVQTVSNQLARFFHLPSLYSTTEDW
jgi:hypothetical protein